MIKSKLMINHHPSKNKPTPHPPKKFSASKATSAKVKTSPKDSATTPTTTSLIPKEVNPKKRLQAEYH